MTTTTQQIANAIKGKLDGIAAIGHVYYGRPYSSNETELRNLFVHNNKINAWTIERVSFVESPRNLTSNLTDTTWQINGFYAYDLASNSHIEFNEMVDAIRTAIRDDDDLGGVVSTCIVGDRAGIQGNTIDHAWLANNITMLCHIVELILTTRILL